MASTRADADGDHVGDVYAHDDILVPGRRVYLVLLEDDARGWVAPCTTAPASVRWLPSGS